MIEDAVDGYELELDERTKTAEVRMPEQASSRQDVWFNLEIDRLRRAVDRKQWVINGLLQMLRTPEKTVLETSAKAEKREFPTPGKGDAPHPYPPKPRGYLE